MSNIKLSVGGGVHAGSLLWGSGSNSAVIIDDAGLIDATYLRDSMITSSKLAPGSVASAALQNGAATSAKLAAGAVNATHLAAGAVNLSGYAPLSNAALTGTTTVSELVGAGARGIVGTDGLIEGGSIRGYSINGPAIMTNEYLDGSITSSKIGAGQINLTHLAPGTIPTSNLSGFATGSNFFFGGITTVSQLVGAGSRVIVGADGLVPGASIAPGSIGAPRSQIGVRDPPRARHPPRSLCVRAPQQRANEQRHHRGWHY